MAIIIIPAVIVVFIIVFSVQNSSLVAISFLFWKAEISLALAVLISVLAGIVIGAVIMVVVMRKMFRVAKKGVRA